MKEITQQDLEVWLLKKGFERIDDFSNNSHFHYKINNVMQISWIAYDNSVLARSDSEEKFETFAETKLYIKDVLKEIKLIQKFLAYLSKRPNLLVDNKIALYRHSVHFLNDEINMLVDYKCAIETCEKYL